MKFFFTFLILTAVSLSARELEIVSKTGKSLEASLIAVTEDRATVKRKSDGKIFDLTFDTLSEGTVALVKKQKDSLPEVHPEYEFDVSIGKRRKKMANSWYMKQMEISAKVDVKNKDQRLHSPGFQARMIFVGQDQKDVDAFKCLKVHDFNLAPKANGSVSTDIKPFMTTYDSDNKGYGNIGGYKYFGYVLLVSDNKNNVIYTKTMTPSFLKSFEENADLPKTLMSVRTNTAIRKDLLPF